MSKDSLDDFDILSDDILIEEVGGHIQANLQDEIIREAFKSGVDLREYSDKIKSELDNVESSSIQDYVNCRDQVLELRQKIVTSDNILKRMEEILSNFHQDLGSISSDIQSLQDKSLHMHRCLQNRQIIRGELSQFMAEMVVPEQMINSIMDLNVTDRYFVEQLHELDHKLKFVKEQSYRDSKSAQDVSGHLEQLKIKAIIKTREYLLEKIKSFKKPMTNFHVPQEMMLKYRFFNEFLLSHDRTVSNEISREYLDTASKIYYSYFKLYLTKLMKLQFDRCADKEDLLGREDQSLMRRTTNNAMSSLFSSQSVSSNTGLTGISSLRNKSTVFSLALRDQILNPAALEEPIILPHAVLASQSKDNKIGNPYKFTFEILFRSQHYALLDNCCREYLFLCDFFLLSPSTAQEYFNVVMGKVLSFFHKEMDKYLAGCYDALALLLSIRIVQWYREICKERGVPALDSYWKLLQTNLWLRWYSVMDSHITSVSQHMMSSSSSGGGMTSASGSTAYHGHLPAYGHSSSNVDTRPYSVTRQYAEFCSAIHIILRRRILESSSSIVPNNTMVSVPATLEISQSNNEAFHSNMNNTTSSIANSEISSRMMRLQVEIEAMLVRLADNFRNNKERLTFFINNCDLILSVLTENNVSDCTEGVKFKEIMSEKITEYVDEVLLPYFGSLIHFIKDTEASEKSGQLARKTDYTQGEEMKVQKIIKGFNIDWKTSVEKINSEILNCFTNFCIGTQIFQAVVSHLIQYYRRMQNCMNLNPYRNMPVKNELVNIHHIMVEMKKFKPNF